MTSRIRIPLYIKHALCGSPISLVNTSRYIYLSLTFRFNTQDERHKMEKATSDYYYSALFRICSTFPSLREHFSDNDDATSKAICLGPGITSQPLFP